MKRKKSLVSCRTCLQSITMANACNENYINADFKTVKEKLSVCFPDLNLDITKNFVVCFICVSKLTIAYKYFEECMLAESKIMKCLKKGLLSTDSSLAEFSNALADSAPSEIPSVSFVEECRKLDLHIKKVNGVSTTASDRIETEKFYHKSMPALNSYNKFDISYSEPFDLTLKNSIEKQKADNTVVSVCDQTQTEKSKIYAPVVSIPSISKMNNTETRDKTKVISVEIQQPENNSSLLITKNVSPFINEDITDNDVIFVDSPVAYNMDTLQSKKAFRNPCSSLLPKQTALKSYECAACSMKFIRNIDLQCHLIFSKVCADANLQDSEKKYKCHKCSASFASRKFLNSHFVSWHSTEFICDWCSVKTKSFEQFKMHIQNHLTTKSVYKCPVCFLLFVSKSALDEHIDVHLTCSTCGTKFKLIETVKKHSALCKTRIVAKIGSQNDFSNTSQLMCLICKTSFKTKLDFNMHKLLHSDTFKCDNCCVNFLTDDALLLHLQSCNKIEKTSASTRPLFSHEDFANQMEWINYDDQRILTV